MAEPLFGGIEAGGTKFVLGIGRGPGDIRARYVIPTTDPEQTLGAVIDWFRGQPSVGALGIASFGPVSLDRSVQDWGFITRTTKPGWDQTDVAPRLGRALGVPVGFDTDVNGAALGEARWGAGQGLDPLVYLTVGTGIGGGAVIGGRPLHGLGHPEMGHIALPRHPDDRERRGVCPFHIGCAEGLASGPAIKAQWGASLSELPPDHPAHAIIAFYLAHLVVGIRAVLAPRRIVMGGGVMKTPGLIERVQAEAQALASGYFEGETADLIVPPGLGEDSGLLGAFALAWDACKGDKSGLAAMQHND